MSTTVDATGFFARLLAWRRVRVVLVAAAVPFLLLLPGWEAPVWHLYTRMLLTSGVLLVVFTLTERWPARLPGWLARWALQVIAVAAAVPFVTALGYTLTTLGYDPVWYHDPKRLTGYGTMTMIGLMIAPWVVVSALFRQISGEARRQALAFELERSELERRALDARMRLLQAQVEPHFLFNTLANVRELVETGSPQAPLVLDQLIAYLRAAVPRLQETTTRVSDELDLVRAYLAVMQMRIPDRLQYTVDAEPEVLGLACPATALLTLVENAVRHGIDPAEDGGRIDVRVSAFGGRCRAQVLDTGVGLSATSQPGGTGLANLRERLALVFGPDASLRVLPQAPRGTRAEIEFPARAVPA